MKHPWYQLADQHATNGSPDHMEASQSISRMSFRLQLYFACTFINQAKVQSASLAESVRELPPTPVCHKSDLCFIHLQGKANVLAPPQVSPESIWPYGQRQYCNQAKLSFVVDRMRTIVAFGSGLRCKATLTHVYCWFLLGVAASRFQD